MPVAMLTLELGIEQARSLKDRRQVVRSLKDRLRHGFNISVAELDQAVTWQSATIGIAAVSSSREYLAGQMAEAERAATRILNDLGATVADSWWEFLEPGRGPEAGSGGGPGAEHEAGLNADLGGGAGGGTGGRGGREGEGEAPVG
jgi:uncharacterized protein YlxP (DUF503 family)